MNPFSKISKKSVILILLIGIVRITAYQPLMDDDDTTFEDNDNNDSILKNFQEFSSRKLVQSDRHHHRHQHKFQQSFRHQTKLHNFDVSELPPPSIDENIDYFHRKTKKSKNNDGTKNLDGYHHVDHNKKNVSRRGQRLRNSNNNNKNGNQLFKTTFFNFLVYSCFFFL